MLNWIISFSLIGSIGALAGASVVLLFRDRLRDMLVPHLVSYAAGTLLGAALLGMIPTSLQQAPAGTVMATVLAGLVLFFVLEKLVLWRHCHQRDCAVHGRSATLILAGDALHNVVDGVVIATAFLTSIPLGITTTLAVVAHEIPQEVGDFAILLDNGYSRVKALLLNTLSSMTTLVGALMAYFWLGEVHEATPFILALSAASFIYIALADLIPGLHQHTNITASARQLLLLLAGIGTIALLRLGG